MEFSIQYLCNLGNLWFQNLFVGLRLRPTNVRGYNHADARDHAQPHRADDDVDEPDYFLIISRNCLIFLCNLLLPLVSFLH